MSEPHITEEEARALWRRAAELQTAAEQGDRDQRVLVPAGEGLSLEQVSAAAEGAGIDPDYVRLALAERRLPDAENLRRERGRVRWAKRLLARGGSGSGSTIASDRGSSIAVVVVSDTDMLH